MQRRSRINNLTKRALTAVVGVLCFALLSACQNDARTGAVLGAGIGALAGQAIGGDTEGTLIGAAIGAGVGYAVGNESDKAREDDRRENPNY